MESLDWNRQMAAASSRVGSQTKEETVTSTNGTDWSQQEEAQTPSAFMEMENQDPSKMTEQDMDMDALLAQMHVEWQMESDLWIWIGRIGRKRILK